MGTPKLLLPLGDRTVVEIVLSALRRGGVDRVLVVVGPGGEGVAAKVKPPAEVLALAHRTSDMKETILAGVAHWEASPRPPQAGDALLIVPADHPTLSAPLIAELRRRHAVDPKRLRVPEFNGRRGHPLLLPWEWTKRLGELEPDEGINRLLRRNEEFVEECPANSADVLLDLDVPADYEQLRLRVWDD